VLNAAGFSFIPKALNFLLLMSLSVELKEIILTKAATSENPCH
jgi:hypothetical protein